MLHKATFLTGAAVGYVLGARAGRARYEAIARLANRVLGDPHVQSTASTLGQQASGFASHAGRVVNDRVGDKLPFRSQRSPASGAYDAPNGH